MKKAVDHDNYLKWFIVECQIQPVEHKSGLDWQRTVDLIEP